MQIIDNVLKQQDKRKYWVSKGVIVLYCFVDKNKEKNHSKDKKERKRNV